RVGRRRPVIEETGGKTSRPAVAETRIIFCILQDIVVDPHFTKCCLHFLFYFQIGQVIAERTSHQKFSREIVRLLLGPEFLFGSYPFGHKKIGRASCRESESYRSIVMN